MQPFSLKILKEHECEKLTRELFYLYNTKQTKCDNRCPKSNSVYGAKNHKQYMKKISNIITDEIGIDLIPTFVYSRIYRRGETLHPHTDRKECEYSASITLGYSGKSSWEIFIEDYTGKIHCFTPSIGEAVIFKGNTMKHYRNEFLDDWQTQSIFSFVNSQGNDANLALDPKHCNSVPILDYEDFE